MTKKVLIIDAGCENYAALAASELFKLGWTAEITTVDRDFDPEAEAQKGASADVVIVQTPGW